MNPRSVGTFTVVLLLASCSYFQRHETPEAIANSEFDKSVAESEPQPPAHETQRVQPPPKPSLATRGPLPPSVAALEKEELSRPADPIIKAQLGWRHWCEKRHGIAFEHWLWLEQFEPNSQQAHEALELMALARKDRKALDVRLRCKEFKKAR